MVEYRHVQKIVVVEDNIALSDIYKTRLDMLGYQTFAAYDGIQALSVIERENPDLVLLDLMVPKKAGDQILEEMRDSPWGKNIKVLIISNLNESEAPAGLRNLGIEGYAIKANLSNDQLDKLVDAILKPIHQQEDVVLLHPSPTEMIHHDEPTHAMPTGVDPFSGTRYQGQGLTSMPSPTTTIAQLEVQVQQHEQPVQPPAPAVPPPQPVQLQQPQQAPQSAQSLHTPPTTQPRTVSSPQPPDVIYEKPDMSQL